MAKIDLADLRIGMALATDVVDHNGRLLIPAQTTLTERHIRGLKMWGIPRIDVLVPEADLEDVKGSPPEITPAHREAMERYLSHVFQQNASRLDHPLLHVLREKAEARLLQMPETRVLSLIDTHTGKPPIIAPPDKPVPELSRLTPDRIALRARTIASLPAIYNRLMEVINHPHSSSEDIASVIREDQGLTARLLRIVNSSFYGFPHRIETITRAITIIGTTQLCEMALATTVVRLFRRIPAEIVSQASFWEHSVACGMVARGLAVQRRDANLERLFIAGLLHDIGRAVMLVYYPELCRTAMWNAYNEGISLYNAERNLLGFGHAEVGEALLEHWGLPDFYSNVVARHHRPMAISRYAFEVALVHVSDIVVHTMGIGATGDPSVPELYEPSWETLGLDPSTIPGLLEEAGRQIEEMVAILSQDDTV